MAVGRTFSVKTVHHPAHKLKLILQAEIDKVRVDENAVGWDEGCVVRKEEGGGDRVSG